MKLLSPSLRVGAALFAIWLFFLSVAILGLVFIPRDSPSRIIAWLLTYIAAGPMVLTLLVRAKEKLKTRKKKEPNQSSTAQRP